MMRRFRLFNRSQAGAILIAAALMIFVLIAACLPPLFRLLNTGIRTASTTGSHTQEIYAAEAGAYDSMWKIVMWEPGLPRGLFDPPMVYSLDSPVNGKQVDVTISNLNSFTFQVASVATDLRNGHQSTIKTDVDILGVQGLDLAEFTKYAVTSNGTIDSQFNNVKITGNVWIPDIMNYQATAPNGDIVVAPITGWPTEESLDTYYSYMVNKSNPYSTSVIDVSDPALRGPLYAQGAGNYVVTGSGTLTGPLYIDGNLYLDQYANIHLNGNTIYVTGNIQTHPQSYLWGPGAVIAVGDIAFSPRVAPAYLLVMSVSGDVDFQPNGAFVGAVSGNVNITMKPNCSITWQDPGLGNLDLPGVYNHFTSIHNWSIN